MKKLITSLFVLMAIVFSATGQTYGNYNQFKYTSNQALFLNQDTAYINIYGRSSQYQAICSSTPGVLKAVANLTAFDCGDSLVWRVIKGASVGTIPTVRFMNVRTGEFLYVGLNGGATLVPYMAPNIDPNNGNKDLSLVEQGVNGSEFCYYIEDPANGRTAIANSTVGLMNLVAQNKEVGWKFKLKKGPQPKVTRYAPTVAITTPDVSSIVGGNINLDIQVTKGANDLLGTVKLYHNTTLLTTLTPDANGHATYNYAGLIDGVESFTAAYTGDTYYDPENATLSILPTPNPAALVTNVTLEIPATSEVNKDTKLNIAVKTAAGDAVGVGNVFVYVNNILKNRVAVDALGTGSVPFNNLLVGTANIKAYYFGDKMAYLNSDTARVSIDITPSTSSVMAYPVYFDLSSQPAINKWVNLYVTPERPLDITHAFPQDSVPGITMDSAKYLITYKALKWSSLSTAIAIDNQYPHSNSITLPIGSSRAKWFNIKTPWLNEGSYNVYIDSRVNTSSTIHITDVTLDGKSGYFPNEEIKNNWFRGYGNDVRRWNASAHGGNNGMAYIGSVNATKSDIHDLKVFLADENGADIPMGMLQLIPVEMDSFRITQTAAVSLAKLYYPMFDIGGFARNAGEAALLIYANYSELAIPYQVTDPTVYSKLTTHVIDTLGNARTTFQYTDYVTVYRKDQWTRMAQGPVDLNTLTFTCDLPDGEYYYQEIDYYDLGILGAAGRRQFVKDGTFTVGEPNAVNTPTTTSNIKVYGYNNTLTVKGIKAGAKILVTDVTGRIMVNSISSSDVFTKTLGSAIYIVKVISKSETLTTKVLVK